jgi:hypothetical protein
VSNNNQPAQKKRTGERKKREGERTKWTDEMEKLLLEHLVDAQNAGQGGGQRVVQGNDLH